VTLDALDKIDLSIKDRVKAVSYNQASNIYYTGLFVLHGKVVKALYFICGVCLLIPLIFLDLVLGIPFFGWSLRTIRSGYL
jgi:hypothetical protein